MNSFFSNSNFLVYFSNLYLNDFDAIHFLSIFKNYKIENNNNNNSNSYNSSLPSSSSSSSSSSLSSSLSSSSLLSFNTLIEYYNYKNVYNIGYLIKNDLFPYLSYLIL